MKTTQKLQESESLALIKTAEPVQFQRGGKPKIDPGEDFDLVCVRDVEQTPIQWLWTGYTPRAMLSMLAGRQGLGKTYMLCDMIARVSQGWAMPDGTKNPPARVLFMSREDPIDCVLKPRLVAAGADLSKIDFSTFASVSTGKSLDLADGVCLIEREHTEKQWALIVVDTFSAFAPIGTDSNAGQDVRALLDPLSKLARNTGAAVVIVAHLRKPSKNDGENPMDQIAGSGQMSAGVRVAVLLDSGPNPGERWVRVVKSNLSQPDQNGYLWSFVSSSPGSKPDDPPKIAWRAAGREVATLLDDRKAKRVSVPQGLCREVLTTALETRGGCVPQKSVAVLVWSALRQRGGTLVGVKKCDVAAVVESLLLEPEGAFEVGDGAKGVRLVALKGHLPESPSTMAKRLVTPGMSSDELAALAGCRKSVAAEVLRSLKNKPSE